MIHLTDPNGSMIAVNPLTVFAVKLSANGSTIIAAGGALIEVAETVAEVDRAIKRWAKGGE